MGISQAEFDIIRHRLAGSVAAQPKTPKPRMNKWEATFAATLEQEKQAGVSKWYAFEGVKLRLADNTSYTPDFLVMYADGTLVIYEVKGFWRDDARVKIKVAAEMFPCFKFVAVTKDRSIGGWKCEEFRCSAK